MSLTSKILDVLKVVPDALNAAVAILPAAWADKVRNARHAIVVAATVTVSVLGAVKELPLPANVSAIVSVIFAGASVITTYWATRATP